MVVNLFCKPVRTISKRTISCCYSRCGYTFGINAVPAGHAVAEVPAGPGGEDEREGETDYIFPEALTPDAILENIIEGPNDEVLEDEANLTVSYQEAMRALRVVQKYAMANNNLELLAECGNCERGLEDGTCRQAKHPVQYSQFLRSFLYFV